MTIDKTLEVHNLIENYKKELLKNSKELSPIFDAVVDLMMEFKQDYKELHTDISNTYINKLKNNPGIGNNVSKIRTLTGLTESVVKKGIANNLEFSIEKQKNLLAAAYTEINSYCYHNKVNKMPLIEFYRSMQSYSDGHISINSQLIKLIEIGLINKDTDGVSVKYDKPINKRSNDEYLKIISEGINQLVSTVIYNKNKPDHFPALFQRRIRSTQIHPKKSLYLTNEINNLLGDCIEQLNNLLTRNEEDVPSGTYPEIVINLLQYNKTLTEKKP